MIVFMLLVLGLLSLLSDTYIGMRYVRRSRRRWLRIAFLGQAAVLDIVLPAALFFVGNIYARDGAAAQAMLWLMWLLLLSFMPKTVFAVFLLVNDGLNRLLRRRWRLFGVMGGAAALIIGGLMIYGAVKGVTAVQVNTIIVESPKIPAAFDGYRIVQFSDLHIGNLPPQSRLMRNMIDTIEALRPDLIVNSGDLVNIRSSEITPEVFRQLGELHAPDGVVSVLGNHDLGIYIPQAGGAANLSLERLIGIQKALGWHLLQNEKRWMRRGNDSIVVAGIDFPSNGSHRGMHQVGVNSDLARSMRGVDSSHFAVLVSHTPSIWDSIPAVAAPDLTVSGHIHAMQFKLSAGRCRFSPAEFMYPEWSGLYDDNGRKLYVNDGMGYVLFPMRIGAPAEITLYELRHSTE